MTFRKWSNLIHLTLQENLIKNVLLLRADKKTMREIGKIVGKSRTVIQNIIDSNK